MIPARIATKDTTLDKKAAILRSSSLFVDPTDGAEFAQKQGIFLVIAGLKPVSEASSGHWEPLPNGRRIVFDDPKEVSSLLKDLGLQYRLRHDEYATDAGVSLSSDLLDEYEQACTMHDEMQLQTSVGKLFGYPDTAVEAFAKSNEGEETNYLISVDEQDRIERQNKLSEKYFINFRFSREHYIDELKVCLYWQEVLRLYGLL